MENPTESAILDIANDQGPFVRVGKAFVISKKRWYGPVVASAQALYLVHVRANNQLAAFGLAGALLSAALDKRRSTIATSRLDGLPEPIRNFLGKKIKPATMVLVLPKTAASRVSLSGVNNCMIVRIGNDIIKIDTPMLRNGNTRATMAELSWKLNADLTPTSEPLHGDSAQLEQLTPPRPMALRILLFVLAIAIFLGIIALRIYAGH